MNAADGVDDAVERRRVGDPVAAVVLRLETLLAQLLLDLRAGAVHQNEADAERGQQIDVVGQRPRQRPHDRLCRRRQ